MVHHVLSPSHMPILLDDDGRSAARGGRSSSFVCPDALLYRVRAEFNEAPGLALTPAQAARFLGLDPVHCSRALELLAQSGYLTTLAGGRYARYNAR